MEQTQTVNDDLPVRDEPDTTKTPTTQVDGLSKDQLVQVFSNWLDHNEEDFKGLRGRETETSQDGKSFTLRFHESFTLMMILDEIENEQTEQEKGQEE